MIKKLCICIITACALLCLGGCNGKEATEETPKGDGILSEFSATDLDGNIVDSSVFQGYKLTMVNVWATWCPPCREELPALAELNAEYAGDGFQVIGIAYDTADKNYNRVQSALDSAKTVTSAAGANYRHLIPSESLKDFLGTVQAVPVTVFVDGNGRQVGTTYVGAKSKGAWAKLIESHLQIAASYN